MKTGTTVILLLVLIGAWLFPSPCRSEEKILFSFDNDTEGWFVGGHRPSHPAGGSRIEDTSRNGKGTLVFRYEKDEEVTLGRSHFNEGPPEQYREQIEKMGPAKRVDLGGSEGLCFWIKPARQTSLLISLTEKDGSQYIFPLRLEDPDWEKVEIAYRDFSLARRSKDENRRIDPGEIWLMDFRDLDMKTKGKGPANTLCMDDFGILTGEGALKPQTVFTAAEIAEEGEGRFTDFSGNLSRFLSWPGSPINLSIEKRKWDQGTYALEYQFKDSTGALVDAGKKEVDVKAGVAGNALLAPQKKGIFSLSFRLTEGEKAIDEGVQPLGIVSRSRRPSSPEDNPFGTCVISDFRHTSSAGEDYAFVDALGIGWYRPIVFWPAIERKKGKYDWTKLDAQVEEGTAHGIALAPLVAHVPKWASTKGERSPPKDNRDFKRFMFDLVSRYKGRIKYWTLWNEQNSKKGWPDWTPESYVAFLKNGYLGAKQADPDVKILIGGIAFMDYAYVRDFYEAGGKDYFDIMNLHPYCFPDPPERLRGSRLLKASCGKEASLMGIHKIRSIMQDFEDEKKPIWITEISWGTGKGKKKGVKNELLPFYVDEEDQARYLVRAHFIAFALGVRKCFILCVPDVSKKAEGVFGFPGLMSVEGIPKRSFIAYANMTSLLDGAVVHRVVRLKGKGGYGVIFRRNESDLVVLWRFRSRSKAKMELNRDPEKILDILGNEIAVEKGRATLDLEISPDPVYVLGPKGFCGKVSF